MTKLAVVSALALVIGFSSNALAQQGGYTGPSDVKTMSVTDALKLGDDTPVILTGKIAKSLGNEKYLFTDATGSVTVEIDNEDWKGVTANENDTLEIRGEVDKDLMSFEIDVDSLRKK